MFNTDTFTTHSLHIYYTFTTHSLHIHYTFTTHLLHIHYTFTTHLLHIHYTVYLRAQTILSSMIYTWLTHTLLTHTLLTHTLHCLSVRTDWCTAPVGFLPLRLSPVEQKRKGADADGRGGGQGGD